MGHQVTLFASGDSRTRAELVACTPRALRLRGDCGDPLAHHLRMIEQVYARADDFDLIHFHIDYIHFPTVARARRAAPDHAARPARRAGAGAALPDASPTCRWCRSPTRSAGRCRSPTGWGPFTTGCRATSTASRRAGLYLAFLGRLSREKRVDRAIEIARRAGDAAQDRGQGRRKELDYCDEIRPLLADPLVEFVGEIGEAEKDEFLGDAAALLFPIDWPEPFGLVMIEAMACGTPVVAFRLGSVPEVMRDGVSGFVVDNVDEAVRGDRAGAACSPRGAVAPGLRGTLRRRRGWRATTWTSTRRLADGPARAPAAAGRAARRAAEAS